LDRRESVSSFAALTPVHAVLARLKATGGPLPSEEIPLPAAAAGRILAADVVARDPVPGRATALIDGFAVMASDLVGASAYAPAIMTPGPAPVRAGDVLPAGTDTVVPPDAVTAMNRGAEIGMAVALGDNVRRAGEDVAAGQVLRRQGQVLRPFDAAIAALAGVTCVSVRVATLAIQADPETRLWAEPLFRSVAAGASLRIEPLAGRGGEADLTIVLEPAVDAAAIRGLALIEAETVRLAARHRHPVLTCPPRPAAAFVLARAVVTSFLDHLMGRDPAPVWRRDPLLRKISSRVGLAEIALVRKADGGLEPLAAGSLPVAALAQAEGYCLVPPESEGLAEGAIVDAYEI